MSSLSKRSSSTSSFPRELDSTTLPVGTSTVGCESFVSTSQKRDVRFHCPNPRNRLIALSTQPTSREIFTLKTKLPFGRVSNTAREKSVGTPLFWLSFSLRTHSTELGLYTG